MKILLVGSFEHPMYAPAFESGFKALGNEMVTVKYVIIFMVAVQSMRYLQEFRIAFT